jgi:hypothetical protein
MPDAPYVLDPHPTSPPHPPSPHLHTHATGARCRSCWATRSSTPTGGPRLRQRQHQPPLPSPWTSSRACCPRWGAAGLHGPKGAGGLGRLGWPDATAMLPPVTCLQQAHGGAAGRRWAAGPERHCRVRCCCRCRWRRRAPRAAQAGTSTASPQTCCSAWPPGRPRCPQQQPQQRPRRPPRRPRRPRQQRPPRPPLRPLLPRPPWRRPRPGRPWRPGTTCPEGPLLPLALQAVQQAGRPSWTA